LKVAGIATEPFKPIGLLHLLEFATPYLRLSDWFKKNAIRLASSLLKFAQLHSKPYSMALT